MKFCVNCGNELPENSKFCVRCGAEIKKEEVKPIEKKTNGMSITSLVLGIVTHCYQLFCIIAVMLLIDSAQFLSHLFGSTHYVKVHDRFEYALILAGRFCYMPIILAIIGLILGIVGLNDKKNSVAKAGIILCITQFVICLIEVLFYVMG